MPHLIIFSLFIALVYFAGALLAYPLQLLLDPMLEIGLRKYFNYATLISGLLVSVLYLKSYQLLSCKAFGYHGEKSQFLKNLCNGFFYGILIMLSIEILLLSLGLHQLDKTRPYSLDAILLLLLKAVLTGLVVAVLEESIFRGALFTGLYKKTGAVISVLSSSMLYAMVHFIRYPEPSSGTDINWLTGVNLLPNALLGLSQWSIIDYFLTLFIFGVLLGLLRLRYQNIAVCIGVHAGVVMLIKIVKYCTNPTHNSNFEYLISQHHSTFGWLSFIFLLLLTIVYLIKLLKNNPPSKYFDTI